jgi:UDP-N-acetylmuramoylalanine--D-glutamate ligase
VNNNKKIKYGVFGLGISGIATLHFLKEKKEKFIAWDDNLSNRENIKTQGFEDCLIQLNNPIWKEIIILVLSPGVPLYFPKPHPVVSLAEKNNIEIICDIELFYRTFRDNIYIGVTGTNGKSTTVALIFHILNHNKIPCQLGGNIGKPILKCTPSKNDIIIIEVSSFQIDLLKDTKFDVAVLLNISKDHLDRHGNMENYISTKYKIFSNQQKNDTAIISVDDVNTEMLSTKLEKDSSANLIKISTKKINNGVSVLNNTLYRKDIKIRELDLPTSLQGQHNQENIAAAYAATYSSTNLSDKEILDALPTFQGLKHRMEYIGEKHNIKFINDSKATNFESTEKALKTFEKIYWIAGGIAKDGGIDGILHFKNKLSHVFLIGSSQENFSETLKAFSIPYSTSNSLENAFTQALELAKKDTSKNKTILLSPAASSLDQWKNFEERGDYFTKLTHSFINDTK